MAGTGKHKLVALVALVGSLVLAGQAPEARAKGPFPGWWEVGAAMAKSTSTRARLSRSRAELITMLDRQARIWRLLSSCASSSYRDRDAATLGQQDGRFVERAFGRAEVQRRGAVNGRATE